MSDELFDMPDLAYTVDVIEAWRIRYWVRASDPAAAGQKAITDVVHRYRAVTQRVAVEVEGTARLGDGTMPR